MEIVNFRSTKKPFVGTFEEEKKKKMNVLGLSNQNQNCQRQRQKLNRDIKKHSFYKLHKRKNCKIVGVV